MRFRSWPPASPRASSAHASRITHHASRLSAIICLGVILRGETVHAAHIGEAVSRALMEIQLHYEVPVIHEVLLLENEDAGARAVPGPAAQPGPGSGADGAGDGAGDGWLELKVIGCAGKEAFQRVRRTLT